MDVIKIICDRNFPLTFLPTVLAILQFLIAQFQLILVPICFILAWGFLIALGGTLWAAVRDTTHQAKTMHQVPCPNCQFFTNDHRLKCTVKPTIANTEEAIDCSDYCPRSIYE